MYFSSAAIVYSCRAIAEDEFNDPEVSTTPTTWFCNIDLNTSPGSFQVRVFTQVDPSEVQDCSFYPEP
jgi:hypothetical protein